MSNIRLQSPLRSFSSLDNPTFRNSPTRLSLPPTQIINLVDDDANTNAPPAIRRRIAEPTLDDDIVILDDNEPGNSSRRISTGGVNRPIVIADSDEEHSPIRNTHSGPSGQRRDSYRIFSPPPPPPVYHPIPPVPSISPPIIANPQPFAVLTPPQAPEDTSRRRLPFDEPPQPSTSSGSRRASRIQLGGGLVSQGIRRPRRSAGSLQNNDASRADGPSRARIVATFLNDLPRAYHHHPYAIAPLSDLFRRWPLFFNGEADAIVWGEPYAFPSRNEPSEPEYTKDITHPGTPPPGWSFNFGTEDVLDAENVVNGKAPAAPTELLVCAQCLDPLYANVEERSDLTAEEKKRKKIWSLRCGHMFDGKCIEGFMIPGWQEAEHEPKPMEEEKANIVDGGEALKDESAIGQSADKGKEKLKDDAGVTEQLHDSVMELDAEASTINNDPSHPTLQRVSMSAAAGATDRYNFRTRRPQPQGPPPNVNARSNRKRSAAGTTGRTEDSPRKTRGTKRKLNGKEAPQIEARYDWTCPVAGCGKIHSSYKSQGVWKPDEGNGPIPIYI